MPTVIEYLADDQLQVGVLAEPDPRNNRLVVSDARGRTSRVRLDKVLFRHEATSVDELTRRLAAVQADVDVALLWGTLQGAQPAPRDAAELAQLYFDEAGDLHSSAIYHALCADRLHFRRRGRCFEPRSRAELAQLQEQQQAERHMADAVELLTGALRERAVDDALGRRLERYLRGGAADRQLQRALEVLSGRPAQLAFELLLGAGRLPATADLEVLQADLRAEHPTAAVIHAHSLAAPVAGPAQRAAFSIDDPETREVDDALSAARDGALLRVDVDIADVAGLVGAGDPVDREAQRRATTVYLPTGTIYMLPEVIGCTLGSLRAGEARPVLRTSVWIDAEGSVRRCEIGRAVVKVARRLDYDTADALLGCSDVEVAPADRSVVEELRLLATLAERLAARRRARGALFLRRAEWKIHVSPDGETISVRSIPPGSPSRAIVAEMMILANGLAAQHAAAHGVPIIYRVQPPPLDGRPADEAWPRRAVPPAALSLRPAPHWGLGLEAYAQVSSPLRRYADLVVQRQLRAALAGEPPVHSADALLAALATAEATEREIKRLESAVTARWALEYVARLVQRTGVAGTVVGEAAGGSRVELSCCGAQGILVEDRPRAIGEPVVVDVGVVRPRQGVLRLRPAKS